MQCVLVVKRQPLLCYLSWSWSWLKHFFFYCWPAGWWCTKSFGDIAGTVAIEMQSNAYVHALDSGLFTLGAPHNGKRSPCHKTLFGKKKKLNGKTILEASCVDLIVSCMFNHILVLFILNISYVCLEYNCIVHSLINQKKVKHHSF